MTLPAKLDIATETTKLQQKIHSLLKEDIKVVAGKRVLAVAGAGEALAALTAEVADTQLPRLVSFHNNRKEVLSMQVAGGRVLCLEEPRSFNGTI